MNRLYGFAVQNCNPNNYFGKINRELPNGERYLLVAGVDSVWEQKNPKPEKCL